MADFESLPKVPAWALTWLGQPDIATRPCAWQALGDGWLKRRIERDNLSLTSYCLEDALNLAAGHFEDACYTAYRRLARDLAGGQAAEPVRLWNYLPGILAPLGALEHRYMVFNAGRFRALREWFGVEAMDARIATASGVGHHGRDFVVHCLSADNAGEPVENPRQTPAYRYSERFGPMPPCFARATRWRRGDGSPWLMVGGTASVRGEISCHHEDLRRQLDETFYNLAAVVRSARGIDCARLQPADVRSLLREYEDLRVYFVVPEQREAIARRLRGLISPRARLEFVHVDLCRPDLLVEIEGLVPLGGRDAAGPPSRI